MNEEKVPPKVTARNLKWLLGELPAWVAEGLIGREAADKIAERYKLAQAAGGRSKLVFALGTLAAVLLGTGVILFFASNWQDISRFGKLFIICTALWGSYLSGYYLRFVKSYNIMGDAVILLGTILFGSGIYLVAQAFNINAHYPNGLLLWLLGLVPLLILMKSRPILAEITILFGIWIVTELVSLGHFGVLDEAYASLMVRCMVGLAIFTGMTLLAYRFGHAVNAALLIPALVVWLTIFSIARLEPLDVDPAGHLFLTYFLFFIALGTVGVLHRKFPSLPPFGPMYQTFSLFFIAAFLYIFTFPGAVREVVVKDIVLFPVLLSSFFIVVVVVAGVFFWRREGEDAGVWDKAELGMYMAMALLAYIFFFMLAQDSERWHIAKEVGVVSNLALFAFIIALITIGYRGGYPRLINLGLFLFVVDLITRYFDWFWKLLPTSLFFMAGGAVLLVGGIFLEKRRKLWVLRAKEAAR